MDCKKVKELVLTDYLDNQMDKKQKALLEGHLNLCPGCKEFSMVAKKVVTELFADVKMVEPPDFIWQRIKERIIIEREKKRGFAANFFEKLINQVPKPVFALATALIMVLILGAATKLIVSKQGPSGVNMPEYSESFDYLTEVSADLSMNGEAIHSEAGFGTSIEKYFL